MAKDNPSHPSKLRPTPLKAGEEFYYNIWQGERVLLQYMSRCLSTLNDEGYRYSHFCRLVLGFAMIGGAIHWQQEPANSSGDVGPAERSFTLQELTRYDDKSGDGT